MESMHAGRILVVDDNEAAAKVLCLVLSLHGYDSREAHSGKQAILIAETFAPQVALVDLGMPIMDGFEIAKSLDRLSGRTIILIAVTGWKGEEAEERSRQAGFHRHLVKPVDSDLILRILTEFGFPPPKGKKPK